MTCVTSFTVTASELGYPESHRRTRDTQWMAGLTGRANQTAGLTPHEREVAEAARRRVRRGRGRNSPALRVPTAARRWRRRRARGFLALRRSARHNTLPAPRGGHPRSDERDARHSAYADG